MAKLSQAQIAMYAQSAGMANPGLMSAIAMAESNGGNPRAHNPIPPDDSYGLWQINMIGKYGPARRKQFGITSNDALYNPSINAKAAAIILKEQGVKAWSTYTNGAYKKYLPKTDANGKAINASWWDPLWNLDPFGLVPGNPNDSSPGDPFGGNPPFSGAVDVGSGIADLAKLGVNAGKWLSNPHNWLNVLYVVVGGVVVVGSLSVTIRSQVIGQAKSIIGKAG